MTPSIAPNSTTSSFTPEEITWAKTVVNQSFNDDTWQALWTVLSEEKNPTNYQPAIDSWLKVNLSHFDFANGYCCEILYFIIQRLNDDLPPHQKVKIQEKLLSCLRIIERAPYVAQEGDGILFNTLTDALINETTRTAIGVLTQEFFSAGVIPIIRYVFDNQCTNYPSIISQYLEVVEKCIYDETLHFILFQGLSIIDANIDRSTSTELIQRLTNSESLWESLYREISSHYEEEIQGEQEWQDYLEEEKQAFDHMQQTYAKQWLQLILNRQDNERVNTPYFFKTLPHIIRIAPEQEIYVSTQSESCSSTSSCTIDSQSYRESVLRILLPQQYTILFHTDKPDTSTFEKMYDLIQELAQKSSTFTDRFEPIFTAFLQLNPVQGQAPSESDLQYQWLAKGLLAIIENRSLFRSVAIQRLLKLFGSSSARFSSQTDAYICTALAQCIKEEISDSPAFFQIMTNINKDTISSHISPQMFSAFLSLGSTILPPLFQEDSQQTNIQRDALLNNIDTIISRAHANHIYTILYHVTAYFLTIPKDQWNHTTVNTIRDSLRKQIGTLGHFDTKLALKRFIEATAISPIPPDTATDIETLSQILSWLDIESMVLFRGSNSLIPKSDFTCSYLDFDTTIYERIETRRQYIKDDKKKELLSSINKMIQFCFKDPDDTIRCKEALNVASDGKHKNLFTHIKIPDGKPNQNDRYVQLLRKTQQIMNAPSIANTVPWILHRTLQKIIFIHASTEQQNKLQRSLTTQNPTINAPLDQLKTLFDTAKYSTQSVQMTCISLKEIHQQQEQIFSKPKWTAIKNSANEIRNNIQSKETISSEEANLRDRAQDLYNEIHKPVNTSSQ